MLATSGVCSRPLQGNMYIATHLYIFLHVAFFFSFCNYPLDVPWTSWICDLVSAIYYWKFSAIIKYLFCCIFPYFSFDVGYLLLSTFFIIFSSSLKVHYVKFLLTYLQDHWHFAWLCVIYPSYFYVGFPLDSLFCSISLYVYLYTSATIFWLLQLCNDYCRVVISFKIRKCGTFNFVL